MVGQKRIGKRHYLQMKMFDIQLQKVEIVLFLPKDSFPVIPTIVDVIISFVAQRLWFRHDFLQRLRP